MTLKEIAQEVGVSISTVSRVINNTSSKAASPEVKERIWEVVRRTGYVPNSAAQNLKLGQTIPKSYSNSLFCLFARAPDAPNDPFFSSLARSVEIEAYKQNYIVKSSFTSFDINKSDTCRMILDNDVSGGVVLGRCDKATLKFLKKHFHYVAYTGLNGIDANFDQILCDGYAASVCALEYLIELGHRRIGYIGEISSENRYRGYRDIIAKYELPFAIRAIKDHGLKIPKDISVISIDDIDTAQYLSPTLTTIQIPVEAMGSMAAKVLIDRINGGHTLPMKINFPCHLAIRESCDKPRK